MYASDARPDGRAHGDGVSGTDGYRHAIADQDADVHPPPHRHAVSNIDAQPHTLPHANADRDTDP
jgi:hypothetical protein